MPPQSQLRPKELFQLGVNTTKIITTLIILGGVVYIADKAQRIADKDFKTAKEIAAIENGDEHEKVKILESITESAAYDASNGTKRSVLYPFSYMFYWMSGATPRIQREENDKSN